MKLSIFLLLICFSSGGAYAQKQKIFQDLSDYGSFIEKVGLNEEKLVVLNKEDYNALGKHIGSERYGTFYGIVYDSKLVSAGQLESKGCWGQFRDLCKSVGSTSAGTDISTISYLKSLSFDKEKKTVIFLYSYQMGKRGVKDIKPVLDEIEKDPTFDYIIMSLDTWNILTYR